METCWLKLVLQKCKVLLVGKEFILKLFSKQFGNIETNSFWEKKTKTNKIQKRNGWACVAQNGSDSHSNKSISQ